MNKININQYNAYIESLKKGETFFSVAVTFENDEFLSVTNNYVSYAPPSAKKNREVILAIDNKLAFTMSELFLHANKFSFFEAVNEVEEELKQELLKSQIVRTIVLSDNEKTYSIVAGKVGMEKDNEVTDKIYELINNPKSQAFFDKMITKIHEVLKFYKYI